MKDYTYIQSQTIEWLRFPLIIAVAFIHNPGLPSEYVLPNLGAGGFWLCLSIYIKVFFSHVLAHIAVPIYFFISGYLFFLKTPVLTKEIYTDKLKKRWNSLVIPYLLWNIFPILVVICLWFLKYIIFNHDIGIFMDKLIAYFDSNGWLSLFWNTKEWGGNVINWIGQPVMGSGPINYPLWYIRDLIVVVLLSPAIYYCIKMMKQWFLIIMLFFYFSGIWPQLPGFSATAILFFGWGGYFSINKLNFVELFRKIEIPTYIATFLLLIADTYYDGGYTRVGFNLYHAFVILGLIAAFNVSSRLIEKEKVKVNRLLTNSVLFVLALHTTKVSNICKLVIVKIFNLMGLSEDGLVSYFLTPLILVTLCVMVYLFANRYIPRLTKVLTGSRS